MRTWLHCVTFTIPFDWPYTVSRYDTLGPFNANSTSPFSFPYPTIYFMLSMQSPCECSIDNAQMGAKLFSNGAWTNRLISAVQLAFKREMGENSKREWKMQLLWQVIQSRWDKKKEISLKQKRERKLNSFRKNFAGIQIFRKKITFRRVVSGRYAYFSSSYLVF